MNPLLDFRPDSKGFVSIGCWEFEILWFWNLRFWNLQRGVGYLLLCNWSCVLGFLVSQVVPRRVGSAFCTTAREVNQSLHSWHRLWWCNPISKVCYEPGCVEVWTMYCEAYQGKCIHSVMRLSGISKDGPFGFIHTNSMFLVQKNWVEQQ
jgi:hypothetical protein